MEGSSVQSFSKHRPSGPMLSISRFVRPSVRLFTFEVPFNGLFAPTSRTRMSNIFTDSESLEKSNGKKWSQIWTFLFKNCRKSRHKKKFFFFSTFFHFFFIFFGFRSFLTVFLPPLPEVGCPIFLQIRNPWGKVMERSGLRYEHFFADFALVHPPMASVLLSASVERCFVSRMRDFFVDIISYF